MKPQTLLVFSTVLFAAVPGKAVAVDETYSGCIQDSGGADALAAQCGAEYLDRLDDDLNAAWARVFPTLTEEGQALLRTEQRSWLVFMEDSCMYFRYGAYGRDGLVLRYPICRGTIIDNRIEYLENLGEFAAPRNRSEQN